MQILKQMSNFLLRSQISNLCCSQLKPLVLNPIVRNLSVSPSLSFHLTPPQEQKKAKKLWAHMYGGGDNGGLDYGWEIMDRHRKGPHKKVRPNRNPLGFGVPFAKAIVIKPVIKKPKKTKQCQQEVRPGEVVHREGADCLHPWGGAQPTGAQCGAHQTRQPPGRAGSEDQVYQRQARPASRGQED